LTPKTTWIGQHKIEMNKTDIIEEQLTSENGTTGSFRSLLIVTASIFTGEVFIMFFLHAFVIESHVTKMLLDGLLLTVLVYPMLFIFMLRPLNLYISAQKEAEKELQKEITQRKQAEEKNHASLKEKEILLKEIHHRVKNNMQVISSLLKIQEKNTDDKKAKDVLKISQDRVRVMSTIHETLYQSDNLAKIELGSYLTKLATAILHSYQTNPGQIKLIINSEEIYISIGQASPLGLIINELITNSLKYAFPDNREGEINISVKKLQEKHIELIVMDNGIGFSNSSVNGNTIRFGHKLVSALVENQLKGSISMGNNSGTKYTIKFEVREVY
jgi:two-component sensor histidine kinase